MIYSFKVDYYDEKDGRDFTNTGITIGKNYTDAMHQVADYVGNEAIEMITLELIAEDTLFLEEGTVLNIKNAMVW